MNIGKRYYSKIESIVDPEFGYLIIDTGIKEPSRTLYFTSNPFLEDGKHIICSILKDGRENLYKFNYHTGEYIQLTDEDDIHTTISYIDRRNNLLYCRTPKKIFSVDLNSYDYNLVLETKELGNDIDLISSLAITCDGKYLISGYLFQYEMLNNDKEVIYEDLYRLFKVDLRTKEISDCRYTNYKVDHIQCSPTDKDYFTYCCWGYWPTHHRVWGCNLDGTEGGPLGAEKPNEHRTHEYFTADGKKMAYHGKFFKMSDGRFKKFKDTFGIMNADGTNDLSYTCPENYRGAGHSCMSKDQSIIIADGELDGVGYISRLRLNNLENSVEVEPIFRHDSSMSGNFEHPHPSISEDNRYVCFATDFKKKKKTKFYIIDLESR